MSFSHVILDMGNVLLRFDPDAAVRLFFDGPEDRALAKRVLFCSPLWRELDRGTVTLSEIKTETARLLPARLRNQAAACLENWHVTMKPLPGAKDFVAALKAAGKRLYLLTNAGLQFYTYFPREMDLSLFDGRVVSAEEKLLKPDPAIYRRLMDRCSLDPADCVFVDDTPENVAAARRLGMRGVVFDGDHARLLSDLLSGDGEQQNCIKSN